MAALPTASAFCIGGYGVGGLCRAVPVLALAHPLAFALAPIALPSLDLLRKEIENFVEFFRGGPC